VSELIAGVGLSGSGAGRESLVKFLRVPSPASGVTSAGQGFLRIVEPQLLSESVRAKEREVENDRRRVQLDLEDPGMGGAVGEKGIVDVKGRDELKMARRSVGCCSLLYHRYSAIS
jgi:hypothetical protein